MAAQPPRSLTDPPNTAIEMDRDALALAMAPAIGPASPAYTTPRRQKSCPSGRPKLVCRPSSADTFAESLSGRRPWEEEHPCCEPPNRGCAVQVPLFSWQQRGPQRLWHLVCARQNAPGPRQVFTVSPADRFGIPCAGA